MLVQSCQELSVLNLEFGFADSDAQELTLIANGLLIVLVVEVGVLDGVVEVVLQFQALGSLAMLLLNALLLLLVLFLLLDREWTSMLIPEVFCFHWFGNL